MPEIRINLDPCNPGQFYACCGLIELLERDGAHTLSRFEPDLLMPHKALCAIATEAEADAAKMVAALSDANCKTIERVVPKTRKRDSTDLEDHAAKDSIAPLIVTVQARSILLDWWLDGFCDESSDLKMWAGNQSSLQTFTKFCGLLPKEVDLDRLLDLAVMAQGPFGVDPRSAWNALDLGYSPNEHKNKAVRIFPAVEILAALGLQGFRPMGNRSDNFRYCLWLSSLPVAVARSACMEAWDGLPNMAYSFRLEKRGSYKYFSFAERADLARE
jgi:CRISPR-associated protein Csx14